MTKEKDLKERKFQLEQSLCQVGFNPEAIEALKDEYLRLGTGDMQHQRKFEIKSLLKNFLSDEELEELIEIWKISYHLHPNQT